MPVPPEHTITPPLRALLDGDALIGEWVLDPRASHVRLHSRHLWGLAPVDGVFGELTGHATVTTAGLDSATVTVAAASVGTGNTRRDTHLRSPDFLDSENHPDITFTADRIRLSDQAARVTGELTVRDRTRPLSFDVTARPRGDDQIGFDAEVRIDRADFGLTWNLLGMASMTTTLAIHAEFARHRG